MSAQRRREIPRVLDVLLPERCASCGAGEHVLCPSCLAELRFLRGSLCARCGAPTAWPVERCAECSGRRLSFARARAAVAYEGPARPLVAAWKERGRRRLARVFADLVVDVVSRPRVEALTFVPADPTRALWRGQNPAETLARLLGLAWDLPVASLLGRARLVPPQRGLTRGERRRNVRGAFTALADSPAAVALIDDVYTTGATVGVAAAELRRVGARCVEVVTFARTVRR
jgi:predicted amidophosphoribosyltransferase